MRSTWVLVGDASKGRLFRVGPRRKDWQLIRELKHPESRAKGRDLITDRPGRVKQSATPLRPAIDPGKQPHQVESEAFAHSIAKMLESGLAANSYEQLVLIAPPYFLGLLRAALSETVAKRVQRTFDKDYTALEARDLAERIWI